MTSSGTQSVAESIRIDTFLLEVADAVNTTLDMDTLLRRVAELVKKVIDYEIFAILLLNERAQELRIRFSVGHPKEIVERTRIKVGQGVTGRAAQSYDAVLVGDVTKEPDYISAMPGVRSELAVPLIVKGRVLGVLDIEAKEANYFTDEHRSLLTLVASRIAIGIDNARLYTRVVKQARTLELLNEISRELTSILNLDQLLERVGEILTRVIDYQMFSILLVDPEGKKLQHRFSSRFKENVQLKHDIPLGRGLVGTAAEIGRPVLVPDVSRDPRYIRLNPETRSELCVPLIYKGTVIGVMDLEHTRRNFFNEDHLRTITTLAGQIAISIENARLYERIAREEQRLERDLAMARELQFRLLPQCCPVLGSAELAAKFTPAHAIGGDLYDFQIYSGGRTAIAIGDVSGKGAPAALYAALVSGLLRTHAMDQLAPAAMLKAINVSLAERQVDSQFVALTYAVWNDADRVLQISNSGLPRPIHVRQGRVKRIEATGIPCGLFPKVEYDEVAVKAKKGDVFILFSDGIVDATNRAGELFGRKRVEEIVSACHQCSADDIVSSIFKAVSTFVAGEAAFDDQTVVAIKIR